MLCAVISDFYAGGSEHPFIKTKLEEISVEEQKVEKQLSFFLAFGLSAFAVMLLLKELAAT